MSSVRVGALVKSSNAFRGTGKIVFINAQEQSATIGFLRHYSALWPTPLMCQRASYVQ